MKISNELERPLRRGIAILAVAAVLATLLVTLGIHNVEAQRRKQRSARQKIKSDLGIRFHVPPIIVDDGSMVIDIDRKLDDMGLVEGFYKNKYPGFRIGRIKIFNGEGERLFPNTASGTCHDCQIELWLRPPVTSAPHVIINDQYSLTFFTDSQLIWETDPTKPCDSSKPFKCRPTNRMHPHRQSHPGYGRGDFQFEKIIIKRGNTTLYQTTPAQGHHESYRIMIWKR